MSTYGTRHGTVSAFTTSTPASTTLFRRLTWEGTVPLEIRVDSKELPANSNRGLECYFIQAARVTYLPLLVPEIKRFLNDVVFDEEGSKIVKEEEWWFEAEDGSPLKWYRAFICSSASLSSPHLHIGTGPLVYCTITTR
jgi:autophagy-related protein 5